MAAAAAAAVPAQAEATPRLRAACIAFAGVLFKSKDT